MEDQKLKEFMQERFPFTQFKKIGFFSADLKNDFVGQAKRVCDFFGYESVYEYGHFKEPIRCHITYAGRRDKPLKIYPPQPFITQIGGLKPIRKEGKVIEMEFK